MLTAVLLLIVAGFSLLYYFSREAPDDELFAQREITDSVYLYITRYKGGGRLFPRYIDIILTAGCRAIFFIILKTAVHFW